MRLAVILVHYHTPELAVAAVEALRADTAGLDVEWLLVDNGSDEAGRSLLESLSIRRIDPGDNLGYAGGVNLGVKETTAERVLLMNPDVLVQPGCVPTLLSCLQEGAAVAGPRFYWDRQRRLLQPPSEVRSRQAEVAGLLASRGAHWASKARQSWRRHARRHWEARGPISSYALSGSLLAIQRSAWAEVGPFDPGFRLYFEETDWLLRAEARKLPAYYVPGAEAVHLYSQSAVREPRAQQWFEESADRFRRRHYGDWFVSALQGLAHGLAAPGPRSARPLPPDGLSLPADPAAYPLWVEISPNSTGFPAAAEWVTEPPSGPWRLPEEIEARVGATLFFQISNGEGREIAA